MLFFKKVPQKREYLLLLSNKASSLVRPRFFTFVTHASHTTPPSNPLLITNEYKKRDTRLCISFFGAEKRIRTSGTFQAHTRFPIVLLKPLRHLCILIGRSAERLFILLYFLKKCKRFYALL